MENLKAQTFQVLQKLFQATEQQEQKDKEKNIDNPEGHHALVTCKELVDLYSYNLGEKDKFLVEVSLSNDLHNQMSTIEFKKKLKTLQEEMNLQDNEFKQIKEQLRNGKSEQKQKKDNKIRISKKSTPNVQNHPQYYRIDYQISHKLYLAYKSLGIGPSTKPGLFSFEQKQQQKTSMNYQKIIQMFKDAGINLQINQKLMITRSIKKFCFNSNFINEEEFSKLFKVIVHGMGYRENIFHDLLKTKTAQIDKNTSKRKNNNLDKLHPKKNYRFKTDGSAPKVALQNSILLDSIRATDTGMLSGIETQRIRQLKNRNSKKPLTTQPSENPSSYLIKAMESRKIGKITWESLFNMKEDTMHNNILIPSFVKNIDFNDI